VPPTDLRTHFVYPIDRQPIGKDGDWQLAVESVATASANAWTFTGDTTFTRSTNAPFVSISSSEPDHAANRGGQALMRVSVRAVVCGVLSPASTIDVVIQ
jgi:hypothetical protein